MGGKSKNDPDLREVVSIAELEELVMRMVDIWMGEMERGGELRPNATVEELEEFKTTVVDSILNPFKTVDGFKERVSTGTKTEVVEIIGRYLQAIS